VSIPLGLSPPARPLGVTSSIVASTPLLGVPSSMGIRRHSAPQVVMESKTQFRNIHRRSDLNQNNIREQNRLPHIDKFPGGVSENTIYIRNLPLTVTDTELLTVFEAFGSIKEIRVNSDKKTGRFFGAVFIEYVNKSAAKLAKIQMNSKIWGDRTIYVDFAHERSKRVDPVETLKKDETTIGSQSDCFLFPTEKTGAYMASHLVVVTPDIPPSQSLYVCGLPFAYKKETVHQLFSRFGTITGIRILKHPSTGKSKGVSFIDYSLMESATAAIDQMNGSSIEGRLIKVNYASHPTDEGRLPKKVGDKRKRNDDDPTDEDQQKFPKLEGEENYDIEGNGNADSVELQVESENQDIQEILINDLSNPET